MKDVILFAVVFFIGLSANKYMIENNKTIWQLLFEFEKPENNIVYNNTPKVVRENIRTVNIQNPQVVQRQTTQNQIQHDVNNGFEIRALGDVDYDVLHYAAKVVNNFYGYNCTIGSPIAINEQMLIRNTNEILNADITIDMLNSSKKIIYIVNGNKKLWANGIYLRGYAVVNGNTVIIDGEKSFMAETLIHEIGHTLGLDHCSNLNCIMAVNNDEYETGEFCDRCKKLLNYNFY